MVHYLVKPSPLKGKIFIPPSKSHTLRALIFSMMAKGKSTIRNYLQSPDTIAMIQAMECFGAKVKKGDGYLEIEGLSGKLSAAENVIDAGNSGQVLRFIGSLAALSPTYTIITGDHSIRHNRPIMPMLEALEQMGCFAVSARSDGFAPIIIKGPLHPGKATLSGEDSQPVSALLIAASFLKGVSHIHVTNPGEKPWIDLTLNWLDRFGIKYQNKNFEEYTLFGGASLNGFDYTVTGDFSSAAYPLVASLITQSELTLENVDMEDVQGDKKVVEVLKKMGADIEVDIKNKRLIVKKSTLRGMRIDVNDFIDAITILAVVGCFAEGKTEIVGGAIARKKECDRIHAIATELKKMGANIEEKEDGLIIHRSSLKGAKLSTYRDHRLVMSLSVAALAAKGDSLIEDAAPVAKSYPSFAADFQKLGAQLEVVL